MVLREQMHQERVMRRGMICFIAASVLTPLPFAATGSELSGLPFFFSKPAGDGPLPAVDAGRSLPTPGRDRGVSRSARAD